MTKDKKMASDVCTV